MVSAKQMTGQAISMLRERIAYIWKSFAQRNPKKARIIKGMAAFAAVTGALTGIQEGINALKGPEIVRHQLIGNHNETLFIDLKDGGTTIDQQIRTNTLWFQNHELRRYLDLILDFLAERNVSMLKLISWERPSKDQQLANCKRMMETTTDLLFSLGLDPKGNSEEENQLLADADAASRLTRSLGYSEDFVENCFNITY